MSLLSLPSTGDQERPDNIYPPVTCSTRTSHCHQATPAPCHCPLPSLNIFLDQWGTADHEPGHAPIVIAVLPLRLGQRGLAAGTPPHWHVRPEYQASFVQLVELLQLGLDIGRGLGEVGLAQVHHRMKCCLCVSTALSADLPAMSLILSPPSCFLSPTLTDITSPVMV